MHKLSLRLVVLTCLLLSMTTLEAASADTPPAEPPTILLPQEVQQGGEASPSGSDISQALSKSLDEAQDRKMELESPAMTQAREASRFAYADHDSPGQVAHLLRSFFGSQLWTLNQDPARFLSQADLEQQLGRTAARVSSNGETALLEAGMPVVAPDESGQLEKVDLSLEKVGDEFKAANPLVDLEVAEFANESVSLSTAAGSLRVEPAAAEAATASRFGEQNVLYAAIGTDRDLLLAPVANGVETFDLLRSASSSEQLRYEIEPPSGASLVPDGVGGANVSKDGETLVHITSPTAVDAQGSDVPVALEIDGDAIILRIPHRDRDVAYPILVDPTYELVEGWYWYGGANLNALSDGTWQWGSNVGWIYGSTSCIYACWGSGRGLFVSAPSGGFGGNQFGQWTYTPPGATSRVTGANLNPFWRDNHNCSKNQYPQPHDYAGIWTDGVGWNLFRPDHANDYGSAQLSAVGRVLVVGLGTGPGGSNPCWRDIMLGGASVWISDPDNPTWNGPPSVSSAWTHNTMLPIGVSASDPGLGVKYFNLFTTDGSGNPVTMIGNSVHSCSGLKANPCPGSWSTQITNYNPASLPTGINALALRAYDPLYEVHYSGQAIFLKVDHTVPVIKTSGELLSPNPIKYHLEVDAEDGSSASLGTAQAGMKKLEFYLDEQYQGAWPNENPGNCVNPQQGLDVGSCKFEGVDVDLPRALEGPHTLKIIATDSYGHKATKVHNLDLPKDVTVPKLTVSGQLKQAPGSWVAAKAHGVTIEGTDLETGVTKATMFVDGEEVVTPALQECKFGGCSFKPSFTVDLLGYEEGPHTVKAVVYDGAGNTTQTTWTVSVDPKGPKLDLTTTPVVPSGWTPQLTALAVNFKALDTTAGGNGSGVTKVEALSPVFGSTLPQTLYSSSCKGTAESPCPQEATGSKGLEWVQYFNQGTIQVPVKAHDLAGNVSTQTLTLKIDRTAPTVKATGPLVETALGTLVGGSSKLDLTITDPGSGVGSVELLLDGNVEETMTLEEIEADGGKQTCTGASATCTLTYSFVPEIGHNLASGNHSLTIRAKDLAERTGSLTKEVTLDTAEPEVELSGLLAQSAGRELEANEAGLKVVATDSLDGYTSGMKWIVIAVDGEQVAALDSCKSVPCPAASELSYTYKETEWGSGPHEVEILATDWVGNTIERRLSVNASITAVAPECPTGAQETMQATGVVAPTEASQLLDAAIPSAVAPSEPSESEPDPESPFDPSVAEEGQHSINEQGIDVVGTPTGGGIDDSPAGSFTVGQALCMQPQQKTGASDAPMEVADGDAVLYANTAPETDTLVRPAAFGTTIVEHLRGPAAPSSFSWKLKLGSGEELRQLANGSVVLVRPGVNIDEVEVPKGVPELNAGAIPDVEAQQIRSGANLAEANNAIEGEVAAVIAVPQAVLSDGSTVPALLQISGGTIVTATLPPNVVADTIAMIIEANTAPEPDAMCAHSFESSPNLYTTGCGEPEDPEAEPNPSADEHVSMYDLQLTALTLQQRSEFSGALFSGPGASASASSTGNGYDTQWCNSGYPRGIYCGFFYDDKVFATRVEVGMFNIPSDSTKANAFKHAVWVSAMVNSDPPDSEALSFALNHEKGQQKSPHRRVRYKSSMDVLNNWTAYVYSHFRDVQDDMQACQHWVSKVGPALFIPFQENPSAWANRVGFQHHNLVYRRKYEGGTRVHLVIQDCNAGLARGIYFGA